MKTPNLPDALTHLHMPQISHVDLPDVSFRDLSIPDVDTDALVGWARGVLPWTSRPSFLRRNLVPLGIGAAVVAVIAYVVISRRRAASDTAARTAAERQTTRVA
ncbi:MAG: hypothetical protein ABIO83_03900 [Ilumatobacteraceae bacterium]